MPEAYPVPGARTSTGVLYCGAMAMTVEAIRRVIAEIAPALEGGWVQKAYQPHDEAITLEIRSQGKTHQLYLSADPETCLLYTSDAADE